MPRRIQRIGLIQRSCLIAIPALLLICDLWWFPVTFSFHGLTRNVAATSLLAERLVSLGTYNGHTVYVSLDSMDRHDFLDYVKGSPNAIVISYFVDPKSSEPGLSKGALARALEAKINKISPDLSRAYEDQLERLAVRPPGDVSKIDLPVPRENYHELPIDRVYAVVADSAGQSNQKVLLSAIPQTVEQARRDNISSLVFPCIGYNWENKNSPAFDEFFAPLFDSLSTDGGPRCIYIPLYTNWPTFTLEHAVKSLNNSWEKLVDASMSGAMFRIYRGDYRWTLLFLTVCLFVSSFYAPLRVKNFLIITVAFIATATGAVKSLEFFTEGHGIVFASIAKISTLAFLAGGFPFLINWNPKSVFSKKGASCD